MKRKLPNSFSEGRPNKRHKTGKGPTKTDIMENVKIELKIIDIVSLIMKAIRHEDLDIFMTLKRIIPKEAFDMTLKRNPYFLVEALKSTCFDCTMTIFQFLIAMNIYDLEQKFSIPLIVTS